ncbi:MAG: hypothetical protein U0U66_03835 [Cytophagaceae bacterium]
MVVFLIIITLGYFIKISSKKQQPEIVIDKKNIDEKEKLEIIDQKIKYSNEQLNTLEAQIQFLSEQNNQKKSITEKQLFLYTRYLIGVCFFGVNVIYMKYLNWDVTLDKVVDLNTAILLAYSFIAFVTYGSLTRLESSLKIKTRQVISIHFDKWYSNLYELLDKRVLIKKEIQTLVDIRFKLEVLNKVESN